MSGERVTILLAGDVSSDLENLTASLQDQTFKVFPVHNRDAIVTLARCEVPNNRVTSSRSLTRQRPVGKEASDEAAVEMYWPGYRRA